MRDLYTPSLQNVFTRPLSKIAMRHLYNRSSLQNLFTRPLSKISTQGLQTRPPDISRPPGKTSLTDLYTSSLQDLLTPPLYIQDLLVSLDVLDLLIKSLHKTSMADLYTRSPGIPGIPRSLDMNFVQDLFTRPLCKISIQDLLTSLDFLDLFTGSLQVLFTRPL